MGWELISDFIKSKVERTKRNQGSITAEELVSMTDNLYNEVQISPMFEDEFDGLNAATRAEWLDKITLRLKSVITTTIQPDNVMDENEDYDRWIDKRTTAIAWKYFDRYTSYLQRIGRPSEVIQNTTVSTKGIIERLGDPHARLPTLQKGLVLGSVQSGKTANFNGVINRAIDAGYDMIIVFSGIMEDLRKQTQKRINNDVVGLGEIDGRVNQDVGVGEIESFRGNNQIYSITTISTDFKKSLIEANFDFSQPKILVCKKNVSVLTNLIYWFKTSMSSDRLKLDKSLLVVDDEADNASLNNLGYKGKEYASKVNAGIRAILDLFERRSYLGYTATPFANILQDQNEAPNGVNALVLKFRYNGEVQEINCSMSAGLFPDKFIYKLATPSSYLGPKRFFSNGRELEGDEKIPLVEIIPDPSVDELINFDGEGVALRRSLLDAIDCFILSIALRDSRKQILDKLPGYVSHHTMLVHISRLIIDQNDVAEKIKKYISWISKRIQDDNISDPAGIYERLKLQWNRFFTFIVTNIRSYLPIDYLTDGLETREWEDISKLLPNAVNNIFVKAVNSQTGDKLEYPDRGSKKYIAVGGNRLSRGFTLEGLTINYFLRDTNYYDTLLQMGRWFGYRPGYIDACRLFIDFDTEDKYNFITAALAELEEQIESMEYQKLKPLEFEMRIRKNPGVLEITRRSILRNANEVRFSFQNSAVQTTIFQLNGEKLRTSWQKFQETFNRMSFSVTDDFYTIDTDKSTMFQLLDLPGLWVESTFPVANIKEYVNLCSASGKLTNWKIGIKRSGNGAQFSRDNISVKLTKRSGPKNKEESFYYQELRDKLQFTASGKSRNIITSGLDEALGIDNNIVDEGIREFRDFKKQKFMENGDSEAEATLNSQNTTIPSWVVRKKRPEGQGLLLIYLMDLNYIFYNDELKQIAANKRIDLSIPLIGYALSFPLINDDPGVVYAANVAIQPSVAQSDEEDAESPEDFNTDINDID